MFLDGMRTGSLGAGTLNSVARTENKSNNVARFVAAQMFDTRFRFPSRVGRRTKRKL
jgi:hypothetical protein